MFRRGHAVVIGINDYQRVNGLQYAVNDAEQVYCHLIDKLGYRARNVKLLINNEANKSSIMSSLEWLAKVSRTFDDSPMAALVFYSGHGFYGTSNTNSKENEGYLCPCETNLNDLSATAISTTELSKALISIKCNLAVVVDACHAESFTFLREANHSTLPALKAGFDSSRLSRLQEGKDWVILSASRKEQTAREDPEMKQGILTHHLLKVLDDYDRAEETIKVLKLFPAVVNELHKYENIQTTNIDGHAADFVIGLNRPEKDNETGYLDFANRRYELSEVKRVDGPDCIIVDAPAGYGKTRLLNEVQIYYDGGEYKQVTEDNWKCILIKLDECPYHSAPRYQQYITNKILSAFGNQPSGNGELAATLARLIVNQNIKVLLLFDSVETHREAAEWFISDILTDVKGRVGNNCIRVVFSGRYTQIQLKSWLKGCPVTIMSLTAFTKDVVRHVIADAKKPPQQFEILSQEIVFLSGGHPRAIGTLVKLLRDWGWTVNLDRGYLPHKDRDNIFNGCRCELDDIIDEILGDVGVDIYGLLLLFCVFRRYDSSILRKVDNLARRSNNKKIKGLSASLSKPLTILISDLVRAGLIDPPRYGKSDYTDGPIRNLLLIKTYFQDNDFYNSLHSLAYKTFDVLVKEKLQDQSNGGYLLQKFYHYLFCKIQTENNLEAISRSTKAIKGELLSCIRVMETISDPLLLMGFVDSLKSDYETRNRLRELVGEDGERDILSVLDRPHREL